MVRHVRSDSDEISRVWRDLRCLPLRRGGGLGTKHGVAPEPREVGTKEGVAPDPIEVLIVDEFASIEDVGRGVGFEDSQRFKLCQYQWI